MRAFVNREEDLGVEEKEEEGRIAPVEEEEVDPHQKLFLFVEENLRDPRVNFLAEEGRN